MLKRAEEPIRRPRSRTRPRPGPWLALFAVGLAARAGYALLAAAPVAGHRAALFDAVAWSLARGGGFKPADTGLAAVMDPLGPWIASLAYRMAGHLPIAAVLLSCVLGGLVPVVVAWIGGATFGMTTGRLAGWVVALAPLPLISGSRLGGGPAFALALALAVGSSAAWIKTPRAGRAFGTGMTWGLATLGEGFVVVMPLLIAAWAWVPLGLTVAPRDRIRHVALLLVGFVLTLAPWTIRNLLVFHSVAPSLTLVDGGQAGGALEALQRFVAPTLASFDPPPLPGAALWGRVGLDPLLLEAALLGPFAAWGVVRTLGSTRRWFLALPLVVLGEASVAAILTRTAPVLRLGAEAMLALLAALGFEDLRRRWRTRSRGLRVVRGRTGRPDEA